MSWYELQGRRNGYSMYNDPCTEIISNFVRLEEIFLLLRSHECRYIFFQLVAVLEVIYDVWELPGVYKGAFQ